MNEHLLRAKAWLLSPQGSQLLEHAGREQPVVEETRDEQQVFLLADLSTLTTVECIEELVRFRTIYTNITGEAYEYLADTNLFDASVHQLRVWLKYFYNSETHSYLLRWIGAILACDANEKQQHERFIS